MRPIKTRECNVVFTGDGADIIDVHVEEIKSKEAAASFDGARELRIYWQPDERERKLIAEGCNVRIHMLNGVSPHWLEVVDSGEVEDSP